MTIPAQYANRYVYHFTHIDNLPSLLKNGFLANNHEDFPAVESTSIAASSIQERRATMNVPCGVGGVVHDYVPFYFGSLSPMLLGVVNKKNIDQSDILYFEFPISILNRTGAVFTDASANTVSPPNFYDNGQYLTRLNWAEIDSLKWKSDSEALRHQRMAELLVPYSINVQAASRVVVWNNAVRNEVTRIVNHFGVSFPSIGFESAARRHYFTKFQPPSDKGLSLVTGPKGIANEYLIACNEINQATQPRLGKKFGGLKALLDGLRKDFSCLPHTAELVGLRSENGVHKRTVDVHTKEVVDRLLSLPEFDALPLLSKNRVELAAYLHDIGKGPKARWAWNEGVQKVDADHPVRAMPMMVDVLLNYISEAKPESVNSVLKLICYHDLVGEVLGKDRDEQQIVDVANDELELDMLFAIGKADATSLVETWWDEELANSLYNRCLAKIAERD
jgi:hypothetical protein